MSNPFPRLEYPAFKFVILGLLIVNAIIYALVDTITSTIDAITWLILLIIYEMETHTNGLPLPEKTLTMMRSVLIGLIVLVFFSYLRDKEWLDVINASLWFALIAIMETEVRWPSVVMRNSHLFWLMTISVFSGLIGMAAVWLWQHNWLDAYDAILWIIAFGSIEADIMQLLKRKQATD